MAALMLVGMVTVWFTPEPGGVQPPEVLPGDTAAVRAKVWLMRAVVAPFLDLFARGLVYLPVSTPSNDFYGGARLGDNLFAESLVCLDAATGKRKWHYQIVHHGLWDYDLASPPELATIHVDGRRLDVVVQLTKTGVKMLSETIRGDVREGDIGTELGEIARQHPNVSIGSYPFFDDKSGPNTNLVIRSRDSAHLAAARADVEAMLSRVRAATQASA